MGLTFVNVTIRSESRVALINNLRITVIRNKCQYQITVDILPTTCCGPLLVFFWSYNNLKCISQKKLKYKQILPVYKLYLSLRQIKGYFLCIFFKKISSKGRIQVGYDWILIVSFPFENSILYLFHLSHDHIRSKSTNPLF